jgi:Transcriptional regulator, AbiEi antitoxin/AbiEi antitoxin C-terminal domain
VLELASRQHGVVTRAQLRELGSSDDAIEYRLRRGRLHAVHRGVYAVGRPQLTRLGALNAAVLASGPGAALSHEQAAEVYGLRRRRAGDIEVTVSNARRARRGIRLHRRALPEGDITTRHGICITGPVRILLDLAARLPEREVEALVNDAHRLDLVDAERLDATLAARGAPALRDLLQRDAFALTDSELERRFLP